MPRSTPFPYTSLFRSLRPHHVRHQEANFGGREKLAGALSRSLGELAQQILVEIGRAVQQECRDLHPFPTRRSSDLFGRITCAIRKPTSVGGKNSPALCPDPSANLRSRYS